jgi:hypothetical protein
MLKTCVQRVVVNIHVGEIAYLLSFVFLLPLEMKKTNLNLPNSKPIEIGLRGRIIVRSNHSIEETREIYSTIATSSPL